MFSLQDVLNGLDLDLDGYRLDETCTTGGSYYTGKDIGMVARAASISRAFGTNHYETFDASLLSCLNKWIRADGDVTHQHKNTSGLNKIEYPLSDTLRDADKLLYDVTWGGMISRGVDDSEDIDPNANFGFVTYNDHHFHLGYWVYAMAYYVQYYPQWGIGKPQ